jgi:hypothetical protein
MGRVFPRRRRDTKLECHPLELLAVDYQEVHVSHHFWRVGSTKSYLLENTSMLYENVALRSKEMRRWLMKRIGIWTVKSMQPLFYCLQGLTN